MAKPNLALALGSGPFWASFHPGQIAPGNIDLNHRPIVRNPDGSISTVRSITVGLDNGRYALLPTVVGRRVVSDRAAIQNYMRTGKHLGIFTSEKNADRYAQTLHEQQAAQYLPRANKGAR